MSHKSSRSHKSNESHRSDRSDKIYKSDSINRTSKTYGFIRPILTYETYFLY